MNRPTEGPFGPNDHEPLPDRPGDPAKDLIKDPALGAAWTDALRALQTIARPHESPEAAAAPACESPVPAAPEPIAAPREVDETLAALQVLARRYTPESPQSAAEHDTLEPQSDPDHAAADPSELGLYAADFDEPTPSARMLQRKRPSWASLALILFSAAVLAVLLVGALSLWRQLFHAGNLRADTPPPAAQDVAAPSSTSAPSPSPIVVAMAPQALTGATDLRAIERAMEDCDLEAAKNPEGLYFLIVPAISPAKDYTLWAPRSVGDIGTSVTLLRSKDALDGLRNGSLALYSGPYRFSIIDSSTEAAHAWQAVTGVAKFTKPDAAAIAGFRVRFGFADFVGDTPSNFRFPRNKGVCYWVSALLRT